MEFLLNKKILHFTNIYKIFQWINEKWGIELEYPYFTTPNKLIVLDTGHQKPLMPQKERKPDMV